MSHNYVGGTFSAKIECKFTGPPLGFYAPDSLIVTVYPPAGTSVTYVYGTHPQVQLMSSPGTFRVDVATTLAAFPGATRLDGSWKVVPIAVFQGSYVKIDEVMANVELV